MSKLVRIWCWRYIAYKWYQDNSIRADSVFCQIHRKIRIKAMISNILFWSSLQDSTLSDIYVPMSWVDLSFNSLVIRDFFFFEIASFRMVQNYGLIVYLLTDYLFILEIVLNFGPVSKQEKVKDWNQACLLGCLFGLVQH